MTNKEKEMYQLLRTNPFITQSDLARRLGITRSSAAVHISNLSKKGYIKGRGYILSEPNYVAVIGAANLDIIGRTIDPLIPSDSNPGTIEMCSGGVGRNISENLARIGVSVKLISSLGDDVFGDQIIESSTSAGIDMTHCHIRHGGRSSTYLAILEDGGEMHIALSDMRILDEIPVEHLARKKQVIENAEILVIDSGLVESAIEFILANFGDSRIFLDPVSVGKSKHVKNYISSFHTLKANRLEAEFLSGIPIENDDSLRRVGEYFLNKGIHRVFISLGGRGLYYCTPEGDDIVPTLRVEPVNPTGAGDALMAGIVYATLQEMSSRDTAIFGSAMARIALMSESTVSPLMSLNNVNNEITKQQDWMETQYGTVS